MNKNVYKSIISKISTVTPLFSKALFDVALKKRNITAESATPIEMLQIVREDLDPKLIPKLKTANSVLLINAALIIFGKNEKIIDVNPAAQQILSAFPNQNTLFSDLRAAGFVKDREELSALEVREISHSQLARTYNVSITPVQDIAISIIQDVTLKHEIEEEIVQFCGLLQKEISARKDAENLLAEQYIKTTNSAKMAALGEMASGIAHEINTPLAVIEFLAAHITDLSEESDINRTKIISLSNKIGQTVTRIARIIKGLRIFSRDSGNDPLLSANLKEIIEDTLALCSEKFKTIGIEIQTNVALDIILNCRATQISQVLLNLLNNACDALENREPKWIRIEAATVGQKLELSVTDSGSGLSEKAKKMLFQPFFTTKAIDKGTGLGLSISQGIIKNHGGTLELDLKSSQTRFVIRLPR